MSSHGWQQFIALNQAAGWQTGIRSSTNQSSPTALAWARELNVSHMPSGVCFEEGNREVFRFEACLRPFLVTRSFVSAAEGAYCAQPAFQRFLQQKTERAKARGPATDLWR